MPAFCITKPLVILCNMFICFINKFKYINDNMGDSADRKNQQSHTQNCSSFVPLNLPCVSQIQVNYNVISNNQHHRNDGTYKSCNMIWLYNMHYIIYLYYPTTKVLNENKYLILHLQTLDCLSLIHLWLYPPPLYNERRVE